PMSGIQRRGLDAEQVGKRRRRLVAARRAPIDIGGAGSDRIGVRAAAWIAACTALCLRQQRIDSHPEPVLVARHASASIAGTYGRLTSAARCASVAWLACTCNPLRK